MTLTVTSPAFPAGATIPVRYTCEEINVSPPLAWSPPPAGTSELALVVDDPDAPGGTHVHWVVTHLDATVSRVAEGVPGAVQLKGSSGKGGVERPLPSPWRPPPLPVHGLRAHPTGRDRRRRRAGCLDRHDRGSCQRPWPAGRHVRQVAGGGRQARPSRAGRR